jgi:predicted RNA-binding protein with PIN domain
LRRLKKDASNYIVVSSDRRIQEAARKAGARIMSSEEFVHQLEKLQDGDDQVDKPQTQLSELEIQRWQKLFDNNSKPE